MVAIEFSHETETNKTCGARSGGFLRYRPGEMRPAKQDRRDIVSGRRTPEQVEKDNAVLNIDPRQFVTTNMREACERL